MINKAISPLPRQHSSPEESRRDSQRYFSGLSSPGEEDCPHLSPSVNNTRATEIWNEWYSPYMTPRIFPVPSEGIKNWKATNLYSPFYKLVISSGVLLEQPNQPACPFDHISKPHSVLSWVWCSPDSKPTNHSGEHSTSKLLKVFVCHEERQGPLSAPLTPHPPQGWLCRNIDKWQRWGLHELFLA